MLLNYNEIDALVARFWLLYFSSLGEETGRTINGLIHTFWEKLAKEIT